MKNMQDHCRARTAGINYFMGCLLVLAEIGRCQNWQKKEDVNIAESEYGV